MISKFDIDVAVINYFFQDEELFYNLKVLFKSLLTTIQKKLLRRYFEI